MWRNIGPDTAYSQNEIHQNTPKGFVASRDLVTTQELLVYPRINTIAGPLLCFFYEENFEPGLI